MRRSLPVRIEVRRLLFLPQRSKTRNRLFEPSSHSTLRDPALAEEIIRRDEEVDRFYLFIIRQLTMAVLNRSLILEIGLADPRDCLVYRVVSKSLERIADHATTIAKMSASIENPLPSRL